VEAHTLVADANERGLDALTALRSLIVEMAAIIQRYPVLAVSTDWRPRPGEAHRPSPPPAARRMHQAVFALVERGQREGVLRRDLPPELLPQAITGMLHIATRFARSLRGFAAEG
jgi:hypothetical protein